MPEIKKPSQQKNSNSQHLSEILETLERIEDQLEIMKPPKAMKRFGRNFMQGIAKGLGLILATIIFTIIVSFMLRSAVQSPIFQSWIQETIQSSIQNAIPSPEELLNNNETKSFLQNFFN